MPKECATLRENPAGSEGGGEPAIVSLFGREQQAGLYRFRIAELLAERDALANQCNEFSRALIQLRSHVAESNRILRESEARAAHLQGMLQAMRDSTSWKVTEPLRQVMTLFRKTRNLYRTVRLLTDRDGGGVRGGVRLTLRAARAVARHGIRGALQRYRLARASALAYDCPAVGRQPLTPVPIARHAPALLDLAGGQLSVIVCIHNALQDVQRCLASVRANTPNTVELLLVDDGSAPETADFLRDFVARHPAVRLLRNEQARGYTFAANQGLEAASGEYLILLNSDTVVTPEWAERLVSALDADPRLGIVGPLSNTASWQSVPLLTENGDWADNPLPSGWLPERYAAELARSAACLHPRVAFVNGFCFALRRTLYRQIGGFDEAHFGAGYGEENDFCLRAAAAGWSLAIVDDAYVFHAQSRSYSHERRKALCDRAGQMLEQLHGAPVIERGVTALRDSLVMAGIRSRTSRLFERVACRDRMRDRHEGRRILFVLPVLHVGGGANVVITELEAMRRSGVDARIVNFARCRPEFERAYPDLALPVDYIEDDSGLLPLAEMADAVVATANTTVRMLSPLGSALALGYYIQDYEPRFYPDGSPDQAAARASYHLLEDRLVCITKTAWNQHILQVEEGVASHVIGPAYATDLFLPRPPRVPVWPEAPLRIAAMVRPSSRYRGPRETLETLRALANRYGDRVQIELFGCSSWELETLGVPLDFAFSLHGTLTPRSLAGLLPQCDIFADFSHYQAMGLTAMEAMACGLAVIVPADGGANSFARHEANALCVNTRDETARQQALVRLIEDHDFREHLRRQAIADITAYYPERAAMHLLDRLFPAA